MKIVVCVEGGCVQSVLCSEGAEVEIIDWDNIRDSGDDAEIAHMEDYVDQMARELIEVA
jgi:hypothetical protein